MLFIYVIVLILLDMLKQISLYTILGEKMGNFFMS